MISELYKLLENVVESNLPDKPEQALREFLSIVRGKIIESKTSEGT